LEFNIPFQHKYGYIRDEHEQRTLTDKLADDIHQHILLVSQQMVHWWLQPQR